MDWSDLCILQGQPVAEHLPLHEKPLSAKELLASSLLLDLQDWDHLAKRYSGRDRAHHASSAKEHVDTLPATGASASQEIQPSARAEADGKPPVHPQVEHQINGPGVFISSLGISFSGSL